MWVAKAERTYGAEGSSVKGSPMKRGGLAAEDDEVKTLRRKVAQLSVERDASRCRAESAEVDREKHRLASKPFQS